MPDIKPVLVRGDGHVLEWMLGVGKRSTLIYSELLGDPETGGNVLKGDIDFMEMLHSPFSIQKGCLVRFSGDLFLINMQMNRLVLGMRICKYQVLMCVGLGNPWHLLKLQHCLPLCLQSGSLWKERATAASSQMAPLSHFKENSF